MSSADLRNGLPGLVTQVTRNFAHMTCTALLICTPMKYALNRFFCIMMCYAVFVLVCCLYTLPRRITYVQIHLQYAYTYTERLRTVWMRTTDQWSTSNKQMYPTQKKMYQRLWTEFVWQIDYTTVALSVYLEVSLLISQFRFSISVWLIICKGLWYNYVSKNIMRTT